MRTSAINPKQTEEFLLMQDNVVDASVWLDHGALLAHVTPASGTRLDGLTLRNVCAAHIGEELTPAEIIVIE